MSQFDFSQVKLLVWTTFNVSDIDALLECRTKESTYNVLESHLKMKSSNRKDKVLLDLYYYGFQFCKENQFSKDKISAFLSILIELHRFNAETRNDNLDILQKYFNELIVRHSINRPPFSIQIFKLQDVIKITEYLSKNYLSNYKLYKYVFTSSIVCNIEFTYADLKNELLNRQDSAFSAESKFTHVDSEVQESNENESVNEGNETLKKFREFVQEFVQNEIQEKYSFQKI